MEVYVFDFDCFSGYNHLNPPMERLWTFWQDSILNNDKRCK